MKVISKCMVNVGDGTPEEIERAMQNNDIPLVAQVKEVLYDTEWRNGPSTSGQVRVTVLKFEWESER